MKLFRPHKKYIALFMLVIMTLLTTSNFGFRQEVVELVKEKASSVAVISSDDSENGHGLRDFKPPKHSFVDYTALFLSGVLPEYHPVVAYLAVAEPFQVLPEVYLDIFIPPEPACLVTT